MFDWTDQAKVKNFREYYFYLLFAYNGRIGRSDFARGLFLGYFFLVIIYMIVFYLSSILFFNWESGVAFFLWFIVVLIPVICLLIFPLVFLIQKRLRDMGFTSDGRAIIIVGAFFGTILYLLGPIILVSACLIAPGEKFNNAYGKPCTLYEDLKRRVADLVNAAKSCLGRNDFEGAIQSYTELGDSKSVQETKKAHISHNYDLLHSHVTRMNDKGVLCEDLVNSTNDLSSLVNSYLGIKPQERPSAPPKSDNRLSFSESESGKEEPKAE